MATEDNQSITHVDLRSLGIAMLRDNPTVATFNVGGWEDLFVSCGKPRNNKIGADCGPFIGDMLRHNSPWAEELLKL